jgi:tetratricopeptide (TPR) repeat protein
MGLEAEIDLQYVQDLVDLDSNCITALHIMQYLYYFKQEWSNCVVVSEKLLQNISSMETRIGKSMNELRFEVSFMIATSCFKIDDIGKSADVFREILKDLPEHLPTLCGYGQVLLELGKYEESQRCFSRILQMDPGNKEAKCNIGWVRVRVIRERSASIIKSLSVKLQARKRNWQ